MFSSKKGKFYINTFLVLFTFFSACFCLYIFIYDNFSVYLEQINSLREKSLREIILANDPYYDLSVLTEHFNDERADRNSIYYIGRDDELLYIQLFYLFYPTLPKEILLTDGDVKPVIYQKEESEMNDLIMEYGMTSEVFEGGVENLGEFTREGDIIISQSKIPITSSLFEEKSYSGCFVYTRL